MIKFSNVSNAIIVEQDVYYLSDYDKIKEELIKLNILHESIIDDSPQVVRTQSQLYSYIFNTYIKPGLLFV